jgi:hypothetical protein
VLVVNGVIFIGGHPGRTALPALWRQFTPHDRPSADQNGDTDNYGRG